MGEEIKKTKKSINSYGSKKRNRKISQFAYKKLASSIESRAFKKDVGIININPAYTSFQGKLKYMKLMGLSIHQSASYCIARRAMYDSKTSEGTLYFEKPPKEFKKYKVSNSYEKSWTKLYKELKDIRTHYMYSTYNYDKCINLKAVKNRILQDNKIIII